MMAHTEIAVIQTVPAVIEYKTSEQVFLLQTVYIWSINHSKPDYIFFLFILNLYLIYNDTLRNVYSYLMNYISWMAHFLFQPDPIDGVQFKPIKIDIHQGVVKIVDDEIFYDFQLNTTQSVIVGRDREEVLERIQRGFENQFNLYGKLKKENIKVLDYETMQAWRRLQRYVIRDKV